VKVFVARLNLGSFILFRHRATTYFLLRHQKKVSKEKATQLTAYSCALPERMGSEKTRSVNSVQTLSLLIHSLGQMLGVVRMGILAPPRLRIGRRKKYKYFSYIA